MNYQAILDTVDKKAMAVPRDRMTFTQAVYHAKQHAIIASTVATDPTMAVVWHDARGAWAFYSADAWTPTQAPLLPWTPPDYEPFAFVQPDGSWTRGPAFDESRADA